VGTGGGGESGGGHELRLAGLSEGEVDFFAWASLGQRQLANLGLHGRSRRALSTSPLWNRIVGSNSSPITAPNDSFYITVGYNWNRIRLQCRRVLLSSHTTTVQYRCIFTAG
jgi:hypothetical protein